MPSPNRQSKVRRLYPILIEVGLVASLLLVIGAFRANYRTDTAIDFTSPPVDLIPLVPVPPTDITPKPPPPPMPPVPIVVPDDDVLNEDPIDWTAEIPTVDPDIHPLPPPPAVPDDDTNGIFVVVENDPEPIGGLGGILSRLEYPEIARKAGVEGRVTVEFVVEKDGSVSNATVLKGIGAGCDEAALKAVLETRFIPGMQRKVPVRVRMWIPVVFRMRD